MLKAISFITLLLFVVMISAGNAQENPYAVETKVIKNDQAIQNLRQQQANLYLKMEDLLVKYGELKGKIEDIMHRLDSIESRLNGRSSIYNKYNKTSASTSVSPAGNNGLPKQQKQAEKTISKTQTKSDNVKNISKQVKSIKAVENGTFKKQTAAASAALSDDRSYLSSKKLYDSKQYDKAIQSFENFKKDYKNSKYIPNAVFYIAQSHFKKGEYDKAIISYDYLINTYPKSNKVASSILKEGISFIKLGDNIDGKYLLKKTINKYPNSEEAKIAKQYLKKLK